MGLLDDKWFEEWTYKKTSSPSPTKLLKKQGKKKKTRRGSGIKKRQKKIAEHQKLMEQYRAQKRARGQMFRDFERLIAE